MSSATSQSHALTLTTLEGSLEGADPTRLLEQAGLLIEHLDDPLVRVFEDSPLEGERPPLRLCIFRHASGVGLFAVLDDHGWVTVGRVDDPAQTTRLRLHSFDRTKEDIVSLVASRFDQRGGAVTDLWVLGRRRMGAPAGEEECVYWAHHGWVSLDDAGQPRLDPAPDQPGETLRRAWRPQPVALETFPLLMQRFCVSAGPGDDLFHPDADRDAAVLGDGPPDIALVSWTPGALLWVAPADTVRVQAFGRSYVQQRREAVRAVAVEGQRSGGPPTRGQQHAALARLRWVVADDAEIAGFEWAAGEAEPRQVWTQRLDAPPRGVALHARGGDCWPEVLVALRHGALACFRHVGGRVREAWEQSWALLDQRAQLDSCDQRLGWLQGCLESDPCDAVHGLSTAACDRRVRQALLLRAIELILEGAAAPATDDAQRRAWLNTWPLTIGREETDRPRWPVADLLGQRLREWAMSGSQDPFLPTFIREIYRGPADPPRFMPAPLSFQERIDVVVRGLERDLRQQENAACLLVPEVGDLCADARRSAIDLWEGDSPPRAEGNVRLAGIGIERWANRFVLTDALPLSALGLRRVEQVVFLRASGRGLLALAEGTRLVLVEMSPSGKIQEDRLLSEIAMDACIARLAVLAGTNAPDRLLVGLSDGRLWACDIEAHVPPARLALRQEGPWRPAPETDASGALSALSTLTLPSGAWLVAAGFSRDRRSALHLAVLGADGQVTRKPEPIYPGYGTLRSLDLAHDSSEDKSAYLVLVGEGDHSHAELWRVKADLSTPSPPLERSVDSRVLAMRFERASEPHYAAIGDRAGLVWGIDLAQPTSGPEAIKRLNWIYQLQGPISGIEPLERDEHDQQGRPQRRRYFLAAAETGHIVLLDARTGRRVWKHRLPAPLRAVTLAASGPWPTPLMAVTLADGTLHIFSYLDESQRDRSFDEATTLLSRPDVQTWCHSPHAPCWRADQEIVWALAHLSEGLQAPHEILPQVRFRAARAQFVRCLVERMAPQSLSDALRHALVQEMTYRDIALLQSYLEDDDHAWDGAIAARLDSAHGSSAELHGDKGRRARMQAQAVRLLRWARQKLTVAQLLAHKPPDDDFTQRWLRLKFCRALVQALQREGETQLLPRLLDILADLSPDFVEACQRACGQVVPYAPVLEGLAHVVNALRDEEPLRPEKIKGLAEQLQDYAVGHKVASLFYCIATLFNLDRPKPEGWLDHRSEHLEAIQRLVRHVLASTGPPNSYGRLCDALRGFLLARLMPEDLEPLDRRHAWLAEATGRLATVPQTSPIGTDDAWAQVLDRLAAQIHRRAQTIVHIEAQHVAALVRPFVRVRQVERIGRNEVRLELELFGEGVVRKADVHVEVSVAGTGGLLDLPGAVRRWQRDLAAYPGERLDVGLRGGLRDAQAAVTIVASTRAGDYEHVDSWQVTLPPAELAAPVGDVPFPSGLPHAFEALCKTLFEPRRGVRGVQVLVADPDLGQEAFLLAGVERYRGLRFDLDAWLRAESPGGPLRRADAERLVDAVAQAVPAGQQPLVLVAVGEAWNERTSEAEGTEGQRALMECLRQRVKTPAEPRMIWMVSSQAASRWANLPCTLAHRLPEASAGEEVQAWLETKCDLSPREATFARTRLGGDLRLLRLWSSALRERRLERGRDGELLQTFFQRPGVFRMLADDLAALSPYELLWTMAGAVYDAQLPLRDVEPGHVARETLRSHPTTRAQPKDIQSEGTAFTATTLSDLRSDPTPPSHVLVEGLGPWSNCRTKYASRLSDLLPHLARGRTLDDRVERFGQRSGQVWRTDSPYRDLVRLLYREHQPASKAAGQAPSADAAVFAALRAEREALLDSLSLAEVAQIDERVLAIVLPTVLPGEHKRLRRLAALWVGASRDGLDDLLREVLGPPDARPPVGDRRTAEEMLAQGASTIAQAEDGSPSGRRDSDLLALGERAGVRLLVGHGGVEAGFHNDYLYWLDQQHDVTLEAAQRALDDFERRQTEKRELSDRQATPRVRLTGPGTANFARDDDQRIAVLNEADVRWAVATGDLRQGLERRTRAQLKLSLRSPFRTVGPLPADSALFVGRQKEIEFIREGLREKSFLIVGSRRIGKTSLLNRVAAWIETQRDLLAVPLDLQGVGTEQAFQRALHARAQRMGLIEASAAPEGVLEGVLQEARRRKRTIVFLFNEIDRLLHRTPSLFERFRALHEQRSARFVMVGYAVALHAMENALGPLHHFTEGLEPGERAITLKGLADDPARALIDLLERAPLALRWKDERQQQQGCELLLDRSYRIPWLLQSMCRDLVLRLERERRDELTSDDIEAVVGQGSPALWQYLTELDYDILGFAEEDRGVLGLSPGEGASERSSVERALLRPGVQLILLALARERYFLAKPGVPAIDRGDLARRNPLDTELGFTIADATEIVHDTLRQILLPHEQQPVREWFSRLNLRDLFRMLTLTLVLEPDPLNADRFGFLLHIYPRELHRRRSSVDPRLEGTLTDQAREFWSLFALARRTTGKA